MNATQSICGRTKCCMAPVQAFQLHAVESQTCMLIHAGCTCCTWLRLEVSMFLETSQPTAQLRQ